MNVLMQKRFQFAVEFIRSLLCFLTKKLLIIHNVKQIDMQKAFYIMMSDSINKPLCSFAHIPYIKRDCSLQV